MDRLEGLSDAELDAIEARALTATPGPWRSFIKGRDHLAGASVIQTAGEDIYLTPAPNDLNPYDQDFIAAAREDIPRLVAEVRRLRRLVAERA